MESSWCQMLKVIAIIAMTITFIGCAHTHKSTDIPSLRIGSPLAGVRPKIFVFKEFKDERGVNPYFISKAGVHEHSLDLPVATVVADAIKKELERNGHTCIKDSTKSTADFIVEGSVYEYGMRSETGFFTGKLICNTAVNITLSRINPKEGTLTKLYEGEYFFERGVPGGPKIIEIFGQAQLNMIKNISTDAEFVSFIKE